MDGIIGVTASPQLYCCTSELKEKKNRMPANGFAKNARSENGCETRRRFGSILFGDFIVRNSTNYDVKDGHRTVFVRAS